MKKILVSLFAGLTVICLIPHVSSAVPGVIGPTGLIRVPSADLVGYKAYNVGADWGVNNKTNKTTLYYKMNLGVGRNMEIGFVGGTDPNSDKIREGVFVNMKYGLIAEDEEYPLRMAIGVENLASYNQTDVYLVASKSLKWGFDLHFGAMGDFPGDKFRPLGMLGVNGKLVGGMFELMADTLVGESLTQVDIGARFYLTPDFVIQASGLNIFEDSNASSNPKNPKSTVIGFSWLNPF